MPIKTYECFKCGQTFERILKREEFEGTFVSECPVCHYDALASELELPAKRNPAHGIG